MSARLMSQEWADEVGQIVDGWPDEQGKADERKTDAYWAWVDDRRKGYNGIFALGVRGMSGASEPEYVALTFGAAGACTSARAVSEAEALSTAKLVMECDYQTWLDMTNGYDISKAMTYHKLPLRVGSASELLRCVYLVHELIVVALRAEADLPEAVPA